MFVFVVWTRVEYALPKRGRVRSREPKRRAVAQTKQQQNCLSQLGAAKWDNESSDHVIYRVNLGHKPADSLLASIRESCEVCGLSGPFFGDGKIGWLGMGGGPEKRVNAKIARQIAERYIRDELDLLAQIRIIAGHDSQDEAFSTLLDAPAEMRERWTFCQTQEIDRWVEYLASKGGQAYHRAAALLATRSQHEAFIHGSEYTPNFGEKPIPVVQPIREHGRMMIQSELDSVKACVKDASVVVHTVFDKAREKPKKEISGTELGTVYMNGRAWDNVLWGS